MKKNRWISAVIMAVLILTSGLSGVTMGAAAQSAKPANNLTEGDYTYTVSDGKATITEYIGIGGNVTIPSTVGGCPVIEIGSCYNGMTDVGAFYGNTTVSSVTIPAGIESVGIAAFRDCTNLAEVIFSAGSQLTKIDVYAFQGCSSLSSLAIPAGVTTIRTNAFTGCTMLADITYPDAVISVSGDTLKDTKWFADQPDGPVYNNKVFIGYKGTTVSGSLSVRSGTVAIAGRAFFNCTTITSLSIPAETVYIGDSAFYGCTNLAAVSLAAGSALYHMGDNVFKNTAWMNTRPAGVVMLGSVLCGYSGEMPVGYDLVVGDNVVSIASSALGWLPNLRKITIPAGVRYIACSETLLSPSCKISPFLQNEALQNITVSAENPNYSSDEYGVLYDKNKTELIQYPCGNSRENFSVPDTVEIIRGSAFGSNNAVTALKKVDLKNVKRIEFAAFLNCRNLTEISFPENLTHLGETSFSGCKGIASIKIPLKINEIRLTCFSNCIGLQNVTIPDSVKFIGQRAFYNCSSLEWISIPESVTRIENTAFSRCTVLTSIIIPANVTYIDITAFQNSPNRMIYGFDGSYAQTFAANNSKKRRSPEPPESRQRIPP